MSDEEKHELTEEQIITINELKKDTSEIGREVFQNFAIDALVEIHKPGQPIPEPCPAGQHRDPVSGECVPDEPEPELPDDGRSQPEKGANQDAKTWKVVSMTDDPTLFKVVDAGGTNVADQFHSQETAQQYIDYYIWKQEQGPSPDPDPDPNPQPGEDSVDKFGIKKIYPDTNPPKPYYEIKGGDIEEHGDYRREWEIWTTPYTDIEITSYFKVDIDKEDTISIKPKGAKHTGPEPQYSACCNIHYVPFSGTGKYIGKQCPHLNYKELNNITPKFKLGNIRGKWLGVKAIEWNEGDNVHWQTWLDVNADNNWKLWIDFIETKGSIGNDKDTETPFTKSPWSGKLPPTILMRVDFPEKPPKNDVEAKFISAREINVNGGTTPPQPSGGSTTKDGVTVPFKIKGGWDYDVREDWRDGGARFNIASPGTSVVTVGYFTASKDGGDEVSCKLLGGRHTDSAKYDGCIYDLGIGVDGKRPRMRCECPHPDYTSTISTGTDGLTFVNRWTGMMGVAIQEQNGVRIQYWQDQGDAENKPANQWKKLYEFFDDGTKISGIAGADRFPLRKLPDSKQNTWRIDETPGLKQKWIAIAEIDVS